MAIPDKLTNFKIYDRGRDMLGTVDVVLPNFQYMTESMSGAGIAGEIDSPTPGHFQSLTSTINWRTVTAENLVLLAPETHHFDARGNISFYDEGTGSYIDRPVRAVMRGLPKGLTAGTLGVSVQTGTSIELELLFVMLSVNNRRLVEVDKLNFICFINGVDYLAAQRRNLGM